MLLYFKPRWKYSYNVIYLFWETCHLHLAARREPGLSSLWLTQCWVCASPCLCEPVGWCSRTQTPTSCCVDPAPPVVQSASAPDVHTSSVSFQPVCPPASLAHTPSNYIRDGQTEEYQNRDITLVVEHGSTVLCQLNVETKIKSQSLCLITDGVSICFSFLFLFYCTCFEEKPTDKGPHLEQQQKNKCKEEDQYVRMAFFCFSDRLLSSVYTNPKYSKATCKQLTDTYNWFC